MAARDFTTWVPIQYDSNDLGRETIQSAVYQVAPVKNMTSNTVETPRLLGADVNGGAQLTEDTNNGDNITMPSYQYNGKHTFDEAQDEDAYADEIAAAGREWLNSYNRVYDYACLGVSTARSTTVGNFQPYDSMYRRLTTTDSSTGYTANANRTAGALTYANLSTVLSKLENGDFWSPGSTRVVAHVSLRANMRNLLDSQNRPIFYSAEVGNVVQDTVFGYPIAWSRGCQVTQNMQPSSAKGFPLLYFVNLHYMRRGSRIEPQSRFIPASQANLLALEDTLIHRARQGFILTIPQAAAVLEVNA
jgi:hypothetical protein